MLGSDLNPNSPRAAVMFDIGRDNLSALSVVCKHAIMNSTSPTVIGLRQALRHVLQVQALLLVSIGSCNLHYRRPALSKDWVGAAAVLYN